MAIRIGVFVCHCGTNIGGTVNVPDVVEYARTIPNVAWAEGNLYTCSEDGLSSIRQQIREKDLNRVVVASCTPRTHEPLFRGNCEAGGLNKYLFEFVNLREHCSWVHMGKKEDATEKAKDLVRMGVAKVALLSPLEDISSDVIPAVLVLGSGITGLSSAITLANQGYRVELVDKAERLGGLLRDVNRIFPTDDPPSMLLDPLIESAVNHESINLHLETELLDVKGFIGNFEVGLKQKGTEKEVKVGTIIIATGAQELTPTGMFGYDEFANVMTQLEFEKMYRHGLERTGHVVMINCVGARIEERSYCGRFCCITGMKNAMLIKDKTGAEVTILQRDIMACGKAFEEYYQKALKAGIRFLRYSHDRPPKVKGAKGRASSVHVYHELMGKDMELPANLVVLTTPLVPRKENLQLSRMLKIPVGGEGFFLEAHQKLRPVEFPTDGIYLAGCARYPAEIAECVAQGYAAAAKAAAPMSKGVVISDAFTSEIMPQLCSACGRCIELCPFKAVDWAEAKTAAGVTRKVAVINQTECKGCGLCVSSCLSGAIQLKGFTDREILAMVDNVMDLSMS